MLPCIIKCVNFSVCLAIGLMVAFANNSIVIDHHAANQRIRRNLPAGFFSKRNSALHVMVMCWQCRPRVIKILNKYVTKGRIHSGARAHNYITCTRRPTNENFSHPDYDRRLWNLTRSTMNGKGAEHSSRAWYASHTLPSVGNCTPPRSFKAKVP